MSEYNFNTINEAIEAIGKGEIIIVADDENRENEGDFICAAELITPAIVNFMATKGRGLICVPIDEKRADFLNLGMMVNENTALHETAFTVSVDLIGEGCTTGISAHDRAKCINALVNPKYTAKDFARPGHIFPLRAKTGGVLKRTGHTEAAVDLARLAGLQPAGVLVEILNEDGSMARLPNLFEIAHRLNLVIITIDDLVAYRLRQEKLIQPIKESISDINNTSIREIVFEDTSTGEKHLAMIWGNIDEQAVFVRIQPCQFEEIPSLILSNTKTKKAIKMIEENGTGIVIFLQTNNKETANNLNSIQRDLGIGAQILRECNVNKIKLLSGTSLRRVGLSGYDIEIQENIPIF